MTTKERIDAMVFKKQAYFNIIPNPMNSMLFFNTIEDKYSGVELENVLVALEAENKAVELTVDQYNKVQLRVHKYPSIGEQLDMLYHDKIEGTTRWEDLIKEIKSDNPI